MDIFRILKPSNQPNIAISKICQPFASCAQTCRCHWDRGRYIPFSCTNTDGESQVLRHRDHSLTEIRVASIGT